MTEEQEAAPVAEINVEEPVSEETTVTVESLLQEKERLTAKADQILGEKRKEKDKRQAMEAKMEAMSQQIEAQKAASKKLLEAMGLSTEESSSPEEQLRAIQEQNREREIEALKYEIRASKTRESLLMELPDTVDKEFALWKASQTEAYGNIMSGESQGIETVLEELRSSGFITTPEPKKAAAPEVGGQVTIGNSKPAWRDCKTAADFYRLPHKVIQEAKSKDAQFVASLLG